MKILNFALMAIAAAVLSTAAQAKVDGPTINWRFATMGKPRAATTHMEAIKKYVESETDGRFTITIGYGTFGDSKEFLDLLKIGAVQGATVQASVSVDRLPLYTVLDLPFLPIKSEEQQREVHDAIDKQPAILKEFAAWGAFPFMSSLLPSYELMGVTDVPTKLADINKMRIRALGGNGAALAKLGAVPSNMPPQELYVALERGLINGVALPYYAFVSYRAYELGKWMTTNMHLASTGLPLTLNLKAWNDLPPQYRDLLEKARDVAYQAQIEAMKVDTSKAFDTIKKTNIKLIEFDENDLKDLRRIGAEPVWKEWVEQQNKRGLPGQEILDFTLDQIAKSSGK
jgi:TRAP-type C4-dicarboxylate transport system substrate-binding protein